jgi:23S rRNA (pseudouridine1915-N3)-methyltransferase
MKITLIVTGKTKESYLQEGIEEYVKRIRHYVPFNMITLQDVKVTKKSGKDLLLGKEAKQVLDRIKPTDHLVLLDERGKSLSSENFASFISGMEGRTGHLVFLVGGAYGFHDEIYSRANAEISLSRLTFSHQMVRLIFAEQLYRAFTILKGEPYHHR